MFSDQKIRLKSDLIERDFKHKKPKIPKTQKPDNFDAIFLIHENASLSLSALSQTEPPIIDRNGRYILGVRQKGSITAWVQVMRQKGIIVTINDEDLATILNDKITGLNLGSDGRTLRNLNTTQYNKYYSELLILLP